MADRVNAGVLKASVADVIDGGIELLPNFELAVVPLLDNHERPGDVPDVRRRLRAEGIRFERHRGALLMAPGELDQMSSVGMFTGFDELYLCLEWNDEFEPFPTRITADTVNFAEGTPLGLEEWMHDSGCLLVVADGGGGLNYATFDPELAKQLRVRFRPVRVG